MSVLDTFLEFGKEIAIDLGTVNTLVYLKGRGIILNEPSVVALDKNEGKILAVGEKANELFGKTPDSIVAIKPLKEGVVADFEATREMLKYFMRRISSKIGFFKPRVTLCVPSGITEVEKKAVKEIVLLSGVKSVALIEESMAAALGAGIDVEKPKGHLILDIGGGTSEISLLSYSGIVKTKTLRLAGNAFDESIMNYIKKTYGVIIGEKMAEEIKIQLYSNIGEEKAFYEVKGRDTATGMPKNATVSSAEVGTAIFGCLNLIADVIKSILEETPPELAADVLETGIVVTGGGAFIKDIDSFLNEKIGIPVVVADNPMECVAIGTGMAIGDKKVLKRSQFAKHGEK